MLVRDISCSHQMVESELLFSVLGYRYGFLLGDGAGVGKGRQLAGIIAENWVQ